MSATPPASHKKGMHQDIDTKSAKEFLKKGLFFLPTVVFVVAFLVLLDVFEMEGVSPLLGNHPWGSTFTNPAIEVGLEPLLPTARLYIVTPCSRPQNLPEIRKSLVDTADWVWIILYSTNPSTHLFPGAKNIYEVYAGAEGNYPDEPSTTGNVMRNLGVGLVKEPSSYIYFLDDDNIMHPNFWNIVYPALEAAESDFLTFDQHREYNVILPGPVAAVQKIDTGMFVTQRGLMNESRWRIARYDADGYLATELQGRAAHHLYINQTCAYYNLLRQDLFGVGVGKVALGQLRRLLTKFFG